MSMMLDTYSGGNIESYHIATIDQYQVAACTTDVITEVRVDILSAVTRRRDLCTNTFVSANTSYNIGKKPVLTMNFRFGPIHGRVSYVAVYLLQMS